MTAAPGRRSRTPWWAALAFGALGAVLFLVFLQAPRQAGTRPVEAGGEPVRSAEVAPRAAPSRGRPSMRRTPPPMRGRVVSSSGAVLPGALVCLLPPGDGCCTLEQCTFTDARGQFSLVAPEWAFDALVASAPGHRARRVSVRQAAAQPTPGEIVIELDSGGVAVSGVVSDASGGVVAGALVSARSGVEGALVATGVSASDGRFILATPPGDIELSVEAPAYSRATRTAHAPEREIALVMALQSIVRGHVLELGTRSPLAGVRVVAIERGGGMRPPHQVVSDDAGGFELPGLAAGTYELVAASAAWRGQQVVVDVAFGEVLDTVEILASSATTLSVQLHLDGEPCPAGSVEISGPALQVVPLGADGSVEIDGLIPGRYLVSYNCVEARPGRPPTSVGGEQPIEVGSEPQTVTLEVSRAQGDAPAGDDLVGDVRIVVRGGDAALGSVVLASMTRATLLRGELSDRNVLFADVPLGVYTAFLERAPAVRQELALERSGQAVEVTLEAPSARVITGRVVGEDGQPAPDVWVRARNAQYPSAEFAVAGAPALTDAQGEFSLAGLFDQTYDLTAEGLGTSAAQDGVAGGTRDVTLTLKPTAAALR